MPIPMATCQICGREVTKRKTLSLAALGIDRSGRVCRNHPEVEALLAVIDKQTKEERSWKEIGRRLRIMSSAAAIRVLCSIHGLTPEFCYLRLSLLPGITPGDVREVAKEVERLGGPIMSREEIRDCIFSAFWVDERRQELGL